MSNRTKVTTYPKGKADQRMSQVSSLYDDVDLALSHREHTDVKSWLEPFVGRDYQ
jgi:hypothetical protein